jgi:glycosyltransferase involved in cell wall biosynthesis
MSKISTTDQTAVFSMIKNEGDIIGDFLDQTLELFDFIYILDHESRDGTYEICQQIASKNDRVHLFRLDSSGYPQSQVTTWFTHEIFRRDNPEWLFLLDADEFLPFNSKKEFQTALGKLPQDKCIGMVWHNIIPDDLNEWKGLSATTFLEATKQGPFPKVAVPRAVMDTIGERLIVFQGNHGVGIDENHPAEVRDAQFVMYHLPYRSLQQAEQKLFLGNLALYNDPVRRVGKGFHWVQMADEYYVSVDTRQETIREQVGSYSWMGKGHSPKNKDTFTPCTYRFNYPKACERSILERNRHLTSVLILWREIERLMASREEKNSTSSAADYIISDSEGKIIYISSNKGGPGSQEVESMPPSNKDESFNTQHTTGDITPGKHLEAQGSTIPNIGDAALVTGTPASIAKDASQIELLKQVYGWMNIPPNSIPLSAWTGHLAFLNALIGLARPSRIVELGVDKACSFLAMCDACRTHGFDTELIGIDTWTGDPHAGAYDGDAIYNNLTIQLLWSYPMARLIRSDFTTARERVPDGIIDLLHIDGYHTYEAVSHDFSTWFSSLSDRGICMFHDIAVKERDFGVYRLWDELKTKWPSIDFQHCFGLGILFVGENQPPAVKEFLSIWNSSELVRESLRSAAELFASTFPARLQALENEKEVVRLQYEIAFLKKSGSWRITAPLRFARRIARRVFS